MRQTELQEQGASPAKQVVRKDWELFWRNIAGPMSLVIAWVLWVMYQIMPRSVVTPLAYSSAQITPMSAPQSASGPAAAVPAATGAAGKDRP